MAKKKKEEEEDRSLARLLEMIDEAVDLRGKIAVGEAGATAEIARLASEARRKGAPMPLLASHVKRYDKRDKKLKPISRQALDTMISVQEKRREPRTTRASRKRRGVEPTVVHVEGVELAASGTLNADALS